MQDQREETTKNLADPCRDVLTRFHLINPTSKGRIYRDTRAALATPNPLPELVAALEAFMELANDTERCHFTTIHGAPIYTVDRRDWIELTVKIRAALSQVK